MRHDVHYGVRDLRVWDEQFRLPAFRQTVRLRGAGDAYYFISLPVGPKESELFAQRIFIGPGALGQILIDDNDPGRVAPISLKKATTHDEGNADGLKIIRRGGAEFGFGRSGA